MSRSLLLALPVSLSLALGSLGCSGNVGGESTATVTPDTAAARAPGAQSVHGPLKIFADALGDVPLTAAQRTSVEQLATDTETRHAAARAAHKDLALAIAGQVQAGAIDRVALAPKIAAIVSAMQAAQPADRAALEQLHALLTPDQRTAFVDALQARFASHKPDGEGGGHGKHGLSQWADDLQLTDAQKSQIHDAMKAKWQGAHHDGDGGHGGPFAEHHREGKQIMTAFTQDRFVMNEVAPPKDVAAHAQQMTDHLLGMAEIALPILTPQQRTIAAQKLTEKADTLMNDGPGLE